VSSGTHARVLTSDSKLPYRLYDTDLFDVLNVARYARLQRTVNGATTNPFNTLRAFAFHDDPARHRGLMSLMNVKYLLLPGTDLLREDPLRGVVGFRLVYDREVKVYENLAVMPRAFLVDRAVHVSADEALVAITRPDFDPRTAPVLLEDPAAPALPAPGAGVPGTAEVTALSANRVVVRTSAARPGYLLLAETNYPGWRAAVDGAPTTVYQANYLFRAVLVPAGAHEVTFSFAPTAYRVALAGSLGCLAAVAGVFVGDAIRRVRGVQA
jgi:hypothetical protein